MTADTKRIDILDSIRAFAILLVMAHHYYQPITFRGKFLFGPFFEGGWSGVDLFFVLSGFLVAGILFKNKKAENLLPVFYLRRALRILIPYYVFLALGFAAATYFGVSAWPAPWVAYLLHLQPWYFAYYGSWTIPFLNVTWSLAIEEYFYLLFPTCLLWLKQKNIVKICWAAVLLLPILRAFFIGNHPQYYLGFMMFRPEPLCWGILLAHGWKEAGTRRKIEKLLPVLKVLWIGMAILILSLFSGPMYERFSLQFILGVIHPVLSVFFTISIAIALSLPPKDWLTRALSVKPICYLGRISYSMYLFHELVRWTYQLASGDPSSIGITGCAIATIAIAAASFELYEKRLVKFGHRFPYRLQKRYLSSETV